MCPELGVAAREKFNCHMSGTTRKMRKGWDKELLNLDTKSERGTLKLVHDKKNEALIGQWTDNKVANFCSALNEIGTGTTRRQVGSKKREFKCPLTLIQHQRHMFGVNKGDQTQAQGGRFGNHAHFKKWHEKVCPTMLDCGPLNAHNAWNASAEQRLLQHKKLARHDFCSSIAQAMCNFKDNTSVGGERIMEKTVNCHGTNIRTCANPRQESSAMHSLPP